MAAGGQLIVPLGEAGDAPEDLVGGKARGLGRLLAAGYQVPGGFCIATGAYERFIREAGLGDAIQLELGRKSFTEMRWEEIWDAALRIRLAFLRSPIPPELADPIRQAHAHLPSGPVAVRSSAPGEDGIRGTFAGLHESVTDVRDGRSLLNAVRVVWASLWSDAALLYRRELGLDVDRSRMAVIVQEFVEKPVSGVAFGRDPRSPEEDRQILEAVPGLCEDMVSGAVDPDRWTLERSSGKVLHWRPGQRGQGDPEPLLVPEDVASLHETVLSVETLLGYPPDIEWTGRGAELTLLQARPVTSPAKRDDERRWYLSLRPGSGRLSDLAERVAYELIPALEAEGKGFAADELRAMDDPELAEAILVRHEAHDRWKRIYREEFIPFAHGVRRFGQYYNDAVRPTDPYEFVGLLENQPMFASLRNDALAHLAEHVRREPSLAGWLERPEVVEGITRRDSWKMVAAELPGIPGGEAFRHAFEEFLDEHMNLTYQDEPLDDRPDLILNIVRQLATDGGEGLPPTRGGYAEGSGDDVQSREERFLTAVGPERREEALEVLQIGRLSWRLRDDDNILMGRLRNQLQHAVALAAQRLEGAGRLPSGGRVKSSAAETLAEALRNPDGGPVRLEEPGKMAVSGGSRGSAEMSEHREDPGITPRQLVGQPAARGLVTGKVRVIRSTEDFQAFRKDEILVCDAIQPTMTHLVPLASAIVERRGGMLIHGAIIARELGVPCVNGLPNVTDLLQDGELVTVDGHLGVVTVGPPEFDLERKGEV